MSGRRPHARDTSAQRLHLWHALAWLAARVLSPAEQHSRIGGLYHVGGSSHPGGGTPRPALGQITSELIESVRTLSAPTQPEIILHPLPRWRRARWRQSSPSSHCSGSAAWRATGSAKKTRSKVGSPRSSFSSRDDRTARSAPRRSTAALAGGGRVDGLRGEAVGVRFRRPLRTIRLYGCLAAATSSACQSYGFRVMALVAFASDFAERYACALACGGICRTLGDSD